MNKQDFAKAYNIDRRLMELRLLVDHLEDKKVEAFDSTTYGFITKSSATEIVKEGIERIIINLKEEIINLENEFEKL